MSQTSPPEHDLDKLYRLGANEQAGSELDQRIRAMAEKQVDQQESPSKQQRQISGMPWVRFLSTAAVLVLGVYLVQDVQKQSDMGRLLGDMPDSLLEQSATPEQRQHSVPYSELSEGNQGVGESEVRVREPVSLELDVQIEQTKNAAKKAKAARVDEAVTGDRLASPKASGQPQQMSLPDIEANGAAIDSMQSERRMWKTPAVETAENIMQKEIAAPASERLQEKDNGDALTSGKVSVPADRKEHADDLGFEAQMRKLSALIEADRIEEAAALLAQYRKGYPDREWPLTIDAVREAKNDLP